MVRQRRQKTKTTAEPNGRHPGYPRPPDPNALDQIHPMTGKRYTSDGARIGDGLPDTSILISRMSQADRDAILTRATPPRRGQ